MINTLLKWVSQYAHRPAILFLLLLLVACNGREAAPFVEEFDDAGDWRTGTDDNVDARVQEGVYDFLVNADNDIFWTTAGLSFADGTYSVEATLVEGPLDNGYGMLFRVDDENDNFYAFKVSGDGFVWIGRYYDGINEPEPMIGDWWIESTAVNQGLNATNRLKVIAEKQNMIFFVNDVEVGRITDAAFLEGDLGLMVETYGVGGVRVLFDNYAVTPIEN